MIEEWSNQLLYGGSELVDDLTEHIRKQEENHIMSFLQKMHKGEILSVSCHTVQAISEYLRYAMGQPVQISIKATPFIDEVDLVINSKEHVIANILEELMGISDMTLKNEKDNEPACIDVDKVIFNKRTTVVLWKDGTKTKISCSKKDTFDEETAVAICMLQKILGKGYKRTIRDILKTKAKRYE